jgi:hypothetical protein
MNHARFCKSRRLPLSLIILLAGAAWCTASPAYDRERRHHDHVTISGTPATSVTAGQAYSFTPSATDSWGRTLAFAIANKPSWASFNPGSGQLSGTPSGTSVGTYSNIVIAVSDGVRSATLQAFAVQVLAGSGSSPPPPPPTISGNPATTDVAGSVYAFQPSASGPSGTTLSFSVQNKPAWATFSIATGVLSGTPSSTQTGSYGGIVISVSDGQASSALPAFTVTVTTPTITTGSAVVALVPPTENTNGSALTDLSGMRIHFGSSPSSLTQVVQLPGAAPMNYTVNNLASGTWYFSATAYTTTGAESSLSAVASKTIP